MYKKDFKNDYYLNLFNQYLNDKNKYNDIVKEKKQIDHGIKIYEKNRKNYKTVTEEQIISSKKVSKNLDELIDLIDKHTIRDGDDFIKEPGSTKLSWTHDPVLYRQANEDAQARYLADEGSFELLRIRTFLDDINRGDIKNKKHAQKNFTIVKENVSSEALKEIIKELEKAIFGPVDDETIDTSKDDNYQESIGERVKLKNQQKINKKYFEENYATGYDDLDKIGSLVIKKKFGANDEDKVFGGYKKIIDGYKDGLISKKDIYDGYNNINRNTYLDDTHSKNNKIIASGFKEILSLISSDMIKFDEEKILDSIRDTNKSLHNKEYVIKDKKYNIIPLKYKGLLNKYVNVYEKNPFELRINDINKKKDMIYDAAKIFSKGRAGDDRDRMI